MRMTLATGAMLALLLLSACRTRPFDLSDGSSPTPSADGSHPVDGGQCTHQLEPVRLDSIFPQQLNTWPGASVPVRLQFTTDSCEPPGPLDVTFDSPTQVTVTAHVWRGTPCHSFQTILRVVDLTTFGSVVPGMLQVRDGAPGGTASFDLPIENAPTASCQMPPGLCQLDCQCAAIAPGTHCDPDLGCKVPCTGGRDCPNSAPLCQEGNCSSQQGTCAATAVACGYGQRCVEIEGGVSCRPAQTAKPLQTCRVDADCGFGALCQCGACLLPCIVGADCPSEAYYCHPRLGCLLHLD